MRTRPSVAILLAGALALVALPAAAQKVYIDYDHEAQLDKYKTFAFIPNPEGDLSQRSPLMHKRVLDALRAQIGSNLTEAASNPDLAVTYHVTTKEETQLNTSSMGGYGYGPGWGGGYYWGGSGWGSSTTTVSTYTIGTLVIDIYDVQQKRAIWRGTAQATVPDNPEKGAKKIDKAIEKLAEKWKSMREKKG